MGFIRRQEEKAAARLIRWYQEQKALPELPPEALSRKAAELVDEAHRVARHRGRNVVGIMKEMLAEVMKH